MNKKKLAFAAAILALVPQMTTVSEAAGAAKEEETEAVFTVRADREKKPISPMIFGVNDCAGIGGLNVRAIKQRDMAVSAYNWETNFSNSGISGGNTNDVSLVRTYSADFWDIPALYSEILTNHARRVGDPKAYVTLQMMGKVAADSMGVVTDSDKDSRWLDISFEKGDVYSLKPDESDNTIYIDEYVSLLVYNYDTAENGGIAGYFLDREPDRWSEYFPFTGLPPVTAAELCDKSVSLASAVKAIDPSAEVFGPSMSGIGGCIDPEDKAWEEAAGDYSWFIDYYLAQMAKAEKKNGSRLLDVLDVHYYTEATTPLGTNIRTGDDEYSDECRMQSVRTLWDSSYTENSVAALSYKQFTPFIPTLMDSIRMYYPGTKLSFSEYDFGGGGNISGAIAEVEALGTFAKEGVYLACLSPGDSWEFQRSALALFTDYDGVGGSFGEELLDSEGGDDHCSLYCAERSDGVLTTIVTNQNTEKKRTFDILYDSGNDYTLDAAYMIDKMDGNIVALDTGNFEFGGNELYFTADTESVYLMVMSETKDEETLTEITEETQSDAGETETGTETTAETQVTGHISVQTRENSTESAVTDIPVVSQPRESGAETAGTALPDQPSPVETAVTAVTDETGTVTSLTEGTDIQPKVPAKSRIPMPVKIGAAVLGACVAFAAVWMIFEK